MLDKNGRTRTQRFPLLSPSVDRAPLSLPDRIHPAGLQQAEMERRTIPTAIVNPRPRAPPLASMPSLTKMAVLSHRQYTASYIILLDVV